MKRISGIEQGRAKFAYECANQTRTLKPFEVEGQKYVASDIIVRACMLKVIAKVD